MDSCNVCGSSQFEEIDAGFYCCVCQTQRTGYTVEVSHHQVDFPGTGLVEVRKEKKKKKSADTGVPWTTTEAFNLILLHQCQQLESKLNLGQKFRETLLALWACYLNKCEVAFCSDQDKPKLHVTSHLRDIQLIKLGLSKVTKPVYKGHGTRLSARTGNTRLKRHVFSDNHGLTSRCGDEEVDGEDDGSDDDNDDDSSLSNEGPLLPITGDESIESQVEDQFDQSLKEESQVEYQGISSLERDQGLDELSDLLDKTYNKPDLEEDQQTIDNALSLVLTPDAKSIQDALSEEGFPPYSQISLHSKESQDTILSNITDYDKGLKYAPPRTGKFSQAPTKRKIREALAKFDQGLDLDDLIPEEPMESTPSSDSDDEGHPALSDVSSLSKRSRLIKHLLKDIDDEKKVLSYTDYITMEKMTAHKTLSFILLAFRVSSLNIHTNDIIHWVKMGHLTFYDAPRYLPEQWLLLPGADNNILHPRKSINIENLGRNTATLKNFLNISSLPFPDLKEMVTRYVFELNLPLKLANIVISKIDFEEIRFFSKKVLGTEKCKIIPCYEVYSFCSIVVILRKLFGLDGNIEILLSERVREDHPDAFIWEDWFNHIRIVWKHFGKHFFPINEVFESTSIDSEVINLHHEEISHAWLGTESTLALYRHPCVTESFHKSIAKSMSCLRRDENADLELPTFSVYHFYEAKKFVARRLENLNRLPDNWNLDFTHKSISYLSSPGYSTSSSGSLPSPEETTWDKVVTLWPEPIRLLVNIGCFILNRSPGKLAQIIFRIESSISPDQ